MIKAVIFDIGNVLIRWPGTAVDDDLKRELGLNDVQMQRFKKDYLNKLGTGEITEADMWAQAAADLRIRQVDTAENLLTRVFETDGVVFQSVIDYATTLKEHGFKVALLSNTIAVHEESFTRKGVTAPFDYIFLSHKVGLRKPDPKIYEHALQKLAIEADEALFIDDLPENLATARQLGLHTVLAEDPEQIPANIEHELEKNFTGTKVALIRGDQVLVILRDDVPNISFPDRWDFAGGAREANETPAQTGIREIQEELGITLTANDLVWQKFYPAVADGRLLACFFVAYLSEQQVANVVFGDEGQRWQLMPFQEFIDHPKAVAGMQTRLQDYLVAQTQA